METPEDNKNNLDADLITTTQSAQNDTRNENFSNLISDENIVVPKTNGQADESSTALNLDLLSISVESVESSPSMIDKAPSEENTIPEKPSSDTSVEVASKDSNTSSSRTATSEPSIPTQLVHPKRSLKKIVKSKKEKEREVQNLLKSWNHMSTEEKLNNLIAKYAELHEESRNQNMQLYNSEKALLLLTKEKHQWTAEQSKLINLKSRLEGVCRELQKQNRQIKEESSLKIREEEEKRKEISNKFQNTLNEVSNMMAQNTERNTKLKEDNIDISNRFKTVCEQFKEREEQIQRLSKQLDLERQLADAHLAKVEFELKAERELWNKEREIAKENLRSSEDQVQALTAHVRAYTEKYTEFETTICRSNQVFDNYKSEMNKLNKQMTKVDKESQLWKTRWEKNAKAILELTETNRLQEIMLLKTEAKMEQLKNLCRQLQKERTSYLILLRQNGIEPEVTATVVEESAIGPTPTRKEKQLSILQEEVALLKKKIEEEEAKLDTAVVSAPDVPSTSNTNTKKRSRRRKKSNGNEVEEDKSQNVAEDVAAPTAAEDESSAANETVVNEPNVS